MNYSEEIIRFYADADIILTIGTGFDDVRQSNAR